MIVGVAEPGLCPGAYHQIARVGFDFALGAGGRGIGLRDRAGGRGGGAGAEMAGAGGRAGRAGGVGWGLGSGGRQEPGGPQGLSTPPAPSISTCIALSRPPLSKPGHDRAGVVGQRPWCRRWGLAGPCSGECF